MTDFYMQQNIAWFESEIAKLKRSPTAELIRKRIEKLERELEDLKARYPVNEQPNRKDAAATL